MPKSANGPHNRPFLGCICKCRNEGRGHSVDRARHHVCGRLDDRTIKNAVPEVDTSGNGAVADQIAITPIFQGALEELCAIVDATHGTARREHTYGAIDECCIDI